MYEAGITPMSDLAEMFDLSEGCIEALAMDNGWKRASLSSEVSGKYLAVIDMEMNPEGVFRTRDGGLGPPTEEEMIRSTAITAMSVFNTHRGEMSRRRRIVDKMLNVVDKTVEAIPEVYQGDDPIRVAQRLKMIKEATSSVKDLATVQDSLIDKEREIYGLKSINDWDGEKEKDAARKSSLSSLAQEIAEMAKSKSIYTQGGENGKSSSVGTEVAFGDEGVVPNPLPVGGGDPKAPPSGGGSGL